MTPAGMASLRLATTFVHALPGVQLRLRDENRTVLVVAPPGLGAGVAMSPCEFRMTVGRAQAMAAAGTPTDWLLEGVKLTVDVAVRRGDHAWPDGLYRVAVGGVHVQGLATTLAPQLCRHLVFGQPTGVWGDRARRSALPRRSDGGDPRPHRDTDIARSEATCGLRVAARAGRGRGSHQRAGGDARSVSALLAQDPTGCTAGKR